MLFRKETRDQEQERLKKWRKVFAFFPTRVGTDEDGKKIYAWMQLIEECNPAPNTVKRRLPGSKDFYQFYWALEQ